MTRDEKIVFVQEEILTTEEACKLLGRTRQQLITYMKKGEIAPVKVTTNGNLFLKDDVINIKLQIVKNADFKDGYEAALKKYGIIEAADVIPGQMKIINTDMKMKEEQ